MIIEHVYSKFDIKKMSENTLLLDETDLSLYFESLPRDVTIIVKNSSENKEYLANQQVISTFSPVLNQKIQEMEPSSSKIELELDDNQNLMPLVMDFLHGKKININSENDFYLDKIARQLEIQPLIEAVSESLNEELSVSNIIPRIIQHYEENDPKLMNFLLENIDDIQSDQCIFTLPKELLVTICQSPEANFQSESSKFSFKLKCCAHFLDETELFMKENEYLLLPFDVIRDLVTQEEFAPLDGKIPTLLIVQNLLQKISDNKSKINELEEISKKMTEEIKALQEELKKEQDEKFKSDERYISLNQRFKEFNDILISISAGLKPHIEILDSFKIKNEDLDELSSKLTMLQQKSNDMVRIVGVFHRTNFLYPNSTPKLMGIPQEWKSKMGLILQLVNQLTSNENEVENIIKSFNKLADELTNLSS